MSRTGVCTRPAEHSNKLIPKAFIFLENWLSHFNNNFSFHHLIEIIFNGQVSFPYFFVQQIRFRIYFLFLHLFALNFCRIQRFKLFPHFLDVFPQFFNELGQSLSSIKLNINLIVLVLFLVLNQKNIFLFIRFLIISFQLYNSSFLTMWVNFIKENCEHVDSQTFFIEKNIHTSLFIRDSPSIIIHIFPPFCSISFRFVGIF